MGEHFAAVGSRLEAAVKSYNLAVGSLESRVLVSARKFRDLQAVPGDALLEPPSPIEVLPREVRAEGLLPAPDIAASD
jgi:DNA recombination protein RmuC